MTPEIYEAVKRVSEAMDVMEPICSTGVLFGYRGVVLTCGDIRTLIAAAKDAESKTDPALHNDEAPHTPAAFINAIADEGSKEEAITWLQKIWNERCQLERQLGEAHCQLAIHAAKPKTTTGTGQIT